MKFSIVLLTALLTSIFFFSFQTNSLHVNAASAGSSPFSPPFFHCALISDQACGGITKQTSATIPNNISANIAANFEANADQSMRFAGVFTNTDLQVSGLITIELTIHADDTIEGNVDFTQFAGGQFFCGSGDFEGSKSGEEIELLFTSDDANPACGFYQGVSFTIKAALLNNTVIRGDYSTDTGNKGIVELRRIQSAIGLFLPLIHH